jgi:hypothetical protein
MVKPFRLEEGCLIFDAPVTALRKNMFTGVCCGAFEKDMTSPLSVMTESI